MMNHTHICLGLVREMTIDDFAKKYRIYVRQHQTYPNLYLFKYSNFVSFRRLVVRESRGLILDSDHNWSVVSFPYIKFFNYGEKYASTIDWSTASVYEKLDGSLATLYYYEGEWWVSSSGVPDATGRLQEKYIFHELFWEIWEKNEMTLPKDFDICFMFEMITIRNTIVVIPKEDKIILHGCRNIKTLKEDFPEPYAKKYGWECVKSYSLNSIEEILLVCKKINPLEGEGYVVRDNNFNRIKIKAPQYVALAHLSKSDANGLNYKNMLQILLSNESSEFLSYYQDFENLYIAVNNQYKRLLKTLKEGYNSLTKTLEKMK